MKRTGWLVGGALLVALVGIGVAIRLANTRPRFVPDSDLLAELESAELLEHPLPAATDWPGWRGPGRDGCVTFAALNRKWVGGPRLVHQLPGGDGYSSFAVRDRSAWTLVARGDDEVLICIDLAAGTERWAVGHTAQRQYDYAGPRATPAVDGDDVFSLTSDGVLMCVQAANGMVKWKKQLEASPPRWGFATSPLVDGNTIHLGMAAFDRATGEKRWDVPGLVVGYSSPVLTTVGGDWQLIYFGGKRLVGLRPDTGKELWSFDWSTPFQVNAATPLVLAARQGDREFAYVFITSGYEKGCALVRVAPEGDGYAARAVYESNELCSHFASPVRLGNYVFGLDEQRDLTCLDLRTGKAVWRQRGFRKGSVTRVDDVLVLLGENGNLALARASPDGYKALAMARPSRDRCWATPALSNGLLLLRDRKTIQVFAAGP